MKKIILGLIAVLAFSCTSDKSKDENKDEKGLKLTQVITTDSNGNTTKKRTYTYSENGLLKSEVNEDLKNSQGNSKEEYNYNSNGKLDNTVYSRYGETNTMTYAYNGDLIVKILNYYGHGGYIICTYDNKKQLINAQFYSDDKSPTTKRDYTYDSNGNLIKAKETRLNGGSFTDGATYDNKKNPYLLVYPNSAIRVLGKDGATDLGANNMDSTDGDNNSIISFVYTYNDKDYPTEAIVKNNSTTVGKIKFIYNK